MAIKKNEIYGQIWSACDKLRGGVEPARYKDYILTLLFVKYVSDRFKKNSGTADVIVPKGGSFDDIVKRKGSPHIGEDIDKIIAKLAEANELKGIIDIASFNSDELGRGKEAVDKLSDLVSIFEKPELDFSNNRAGGDDILGDAYEYLMKNFAVESGKSKGQFYTPAEVSRIMAKVIGVDKITGSDKTIYDPACGSGSLLIRSADEAPKMRDGTPRISIWGQEREKATAGLAKMNTILHDMAIAEIAGNRNTLSDPAYLNKGLLERFDFVVVNPPFSDKAWSDGLTGQDTYHRFDGYELPPAKNGDYAWFLHVVKSLKSTGKGAIILPHGVLFRGNAEASIRKAIINRGYIKGIIGLPSNLFFGTSIPACIIVLDKEESNSRKGIFMIDASKGFVKDGNKNRLREQDIYKIVSVFNGQIEIPKYSRFVPNKEIKDTNDYNLNIPRYIDSSEPEDKQDLNAHLNGGIPESDIISMDYYWAVYPNTKKNLFKTLHKGYYTSSIAKEKIAPTITAQPEFTTHADQIDGAYNKWEKTAEKLLATLTTRSNPKEIIKILSESLLEVFAKVPLIDKYAVYQVLMEYWAETMQDDVYAICYDGYNIGREIAYEYTGKARKIKGFDGKLIPKNLIAEKFFAKELKALQTHQAELDSLTAQKEELLEENETTELENTVKENQIFLTKKETLAKHFVKEATALLDKAVADKYPKLTDAEIKQLLIHDKWFSAIYHGIDAIHSAVSQHLSARITILTDRYAETLPQLTNKVKELEATVAGHLQSMGLQW
jgi:type I restriction enzyme M protein